MLHTGPLMPLKYDVASSLSCRFVSESTLLYLTGGGVPMQSASVRVQRAMLRGREHAAGHHEGQSQQPVCLRHGHQAKGIFNRVFTFLEKQHFVKDFNPFFPPPYS